MLLFRSECQLQVHGRVDGVFHNYIPYCRARRIQKTGTIARMMLDTIQTASVHAHVRSGIVLFA